MAVSHVFTSPVADATGTVTNWVGATTASALATQEMRPSDWNSAHLQFMTVTGNTVGQSTFSGTNIVIGGGANITLSGVNATQFNIVGGAGGGGGSLNLSAGTTSNNLTAITFSDSNGVSFGLNGSVVTATVQTNYLTTAQPVGAYLTTARASNDAIGLNSAVSNVTATINSSGLSFDARGYAGTATTFNGANLSGSMTVNSNGVNLSLSAGNYLTSQSNQNVTAANGGFAFQTLSFSNVNGISFGTSAGSAITASHNAITTARASNDAVGLNTAQTNVTWTVNSSGLSLNAAGYAGTGTTFNGANISGSMTVNSVGVQLSMSVGAGGGGTNLTAYAQSNTTQSSSGTIALSSLNFAGAGAASVGISDGSIVISAPNAGAGNVTFSAGTTSGGFASIVFSNSNNVSFGLNGSTITASAAGGLRSYFINGYGTLSNGWNFGNSTTRFAPFHLPFDVSASYMRFAHSWATNSTSFATTINTTLSCQRASTYQYVIYKQMTGLSSLSLESVTSGSVGFTQSVNLGANSTGSQYTVTIGMTYPTLGGTSTYSTSYATSQTRFDLSSNSLTLFTGSRYVDLPAEFSLPGSNYWIGIGRSTNVTTNGTAIMSQLNVADQQLWNLNINSQLNPLGAATNNSNQLFIGVGIFSSNAATTVTRIALASISSLANHETPFFQLIRQA